MAGIRSVTDPGSAGDTSLMTPSDKDLSSGHQRVLKQVNSIKRSKSKYKNGTTSPTSPAPATSKPSDFTMSKLRAASTYVRSNSSGTVGIQNRNSRSQTTKSMKVKSSGSNMEQVNTSSWTQNGIKPSRSDPTLISTRLHSAPSMKVRGQINSDQIQLTKETRSSINGTSFTESQARIFQPPSNQSKTDGKMGSIRVSQVELGLMESSSGNMQDNMTIQQAVEYLSIPDERFQECGANFIQHVCFSDESAKDEVYKCNGIAPLVNMLESRNPDLQRAASGALRNLVFKHKDNKVEVHQCGGVAKILNQIKNTKSTETQRQLAGLLWNMSSAEELWDDLSSTALIALTKNVVMPFSIPTEGAHVDPEVFYYATGCLRNLSSGKSSHREKMRSSGSLIEALVTYISSCAKEGRLDDKPVENCVCTLRNLTYQLWIEFPKANISAEVQSDKPEGRKSPTVGCFSPRSRKTKEETFSNPPQDSEKDSDKKTKEPDVNWLFNPKATDMYVALLKSGNNVVMEASCGAMQNLTASKEIESVAVSEHLFKQLSSSLLLSSLLRSQATQKTYASLLDNMSRKPSLQSQMAPKTLPELGKTLTDQEWQKEAAPESVATVCNVLPRLLLVNQEITKKTMTRDLIMALRDLSERDSQNAGSTAASKLLHNLWTDKNLRSAIKHLKLPKTFFVNTTTIGVIKDSEASANERPSQD